MNAKGLDMRIAWTIAAVGVAIDGKLPDDYNWIATVLTVAGMAYGGFTTRPNKVTSESAGAK